MVPDNRLIAQHLKSIIPYNKFGKRLAQTGSAGDTIQPSGVVKSKQATASSRWVLIDVLARNQSGDKVASGEAMVEFPPR